ncbi:MarR family winged helix-turn-helix transcriptional regulator [Micromonospora sp. PLK6-60]|uniref:MarR family winged helix-turn-helix transcriptional regulator n=1 Tax=Micromonospora sp. PLK6-60 TaxID=2873383 RepID=UPI001CA69079|nr:MarR family winged helix-turn-helix transcriptional regulator [Micromonospora sp. PLK6-60]MBY8873781.1 MarR family winged helix-turn-helix transcriptional regulator [Micromonospora sp. PLK6-60]
MSGTTRKSHSPDQDLGWALGVLLRAYRDTLPPTLGDFPQGARGYQTLCEVVRAEQPSQLALAHRLGIDRTVMTYVIDDLVAANLVERQPNPSDRRQRRIVATPGGRDAVATLCGQVAAAEAAVLGALDEQERTVFRRLLAKAAGGLADSGADACEIIDATS